MSGVKRYDYGYKDDGFGGARYLGLIEKPDGKLVRASDYDRDTQELRRDNAQLQFALERETAAYIKLEAERDELRAQVEAMRGQVEGLKDVLAVAYAWMEDATSKVLYPIALHETGRVAMEAEGLGSCTPDLFKSIDAALQGKP